MEYTLRVMSQAKMDLGVFQETKVTEGIYTRESSGYRVVSTEALIAHSGRVDVFYRAAEHFSVGELHIFIANVVSFHLASSDQWWFIVGCLLLVTR